MYYIRNYICLNLIKLNNLKEDLYTNIAHEFRTPLTVIMGMAEQLTGNDEAKKLIIQNSTVLLRLINQMLDLSKIDAGHLSVNWVNGDIIQFFKYIVESFDSLAASKNITLLFYTEIESLMMDFDEDKIQQVISNLLSNGIKFTPDHGQIVLHTHLETTAGTENLIVKIKDSGIGIRPEVIPHIFDRFFQVNDLSTYRSRGTGIGLALTKELVRLLEGEISVTSIAGKGSTFEVVLPVHNKAKCLTTPTPLPQELAPLEKIFSATVKFNSKKNQNTKSIALIIEDNNDLVTYIASVLKDMYQIEVAENGQFGLEKALSIIPDIIISDVMMPLKDGYEVCHILKNDQRTSHIPIVLLTAKATKEDRITGLKSGADAYLVKPFYKDELLVRVKQLIQLRIELQSKFNYKEPIYLNRKKSEETIDDIFLKKLHKTVEKNIENTELQILDLCHAVHLSHTQVHRKLKALTGKTPSQFIRSIRVNKAYNLLKEKDLSISEIAYETGFKDPAYFSRVFTKEFGKPPRAIRM